jgi:hypothetical protein
VDYVDWVHRVMRVIVNAWREADYTSKGMGLEYYDIVPLLSESLDGRSSEFQGSTFHLAMLAAIKDLQEIGWIEDNHFIKVTPRAESFLEADVTTAWRPIIEITLSDEEAAVLNTTVEVCQRTFDDHVLVKEAAWQEIFGKLGWAIEAPDGFDRAHFVAERLEEKGLIRAHATYGALDVEPRYVGFVRATRSVETEDAALIRQLVSEGETTNTEIKRELQLANKTGKAKFVSRVMGLATTNVSGRRFMIVGLDDKTRDVYGSIDSNITEDRMEQILHEYCQPALDIKFKRVPVEGAELGLIEVIRHSEDIPYRVVKLIGGEGGIKIDDAFVRHGSRTESPTPNELRDLIEEGQRARERKLSGDL